MNESKATRYHRRKRMTGAASLGVSVLLLLALLWLRPALPAPLYAVVLVALHELLTLPLRFYASYSLEHRYELSSEPLGAWLRDEGKGFVLSAALAAGAASVVYALIAWSPAWWWVAAALLGTAFTALLAALAPVLLLPLFYRFSPLDRPALIARLLDLSRRARVPVLGVFEWKLGAKTRKANAALVGSGATRRILLSDTLLADYTDEEIEVILAHELAHHAHRDILKGLVVQSVVLLLAAGAAAAALEGFWSRLALRGPSDPAGLPLLVLAAGAVGLGATPLVHLFSRHNERRADAFALALTGRREAFISAMRRLAVQNLVEESPSRTNVVLFHSHPPIEERIARARAG